MADLLTMLENRMDELYATSRNDIADSHRVLSWDDYNHRAGFLKGIEAVGRLIKEVRAPEGNNTGEILDIFSTEEKR